MSKDDNKYASYNGVGHNVRSTKENLQQQQQNNPKAAYTKSGLSAWGIIVLILLCILLGMGTYYGILCYPIVCKHERMYDIMDAASTSSGTPTRSTEFEKMGNYSSRSTTPSKSNDWVKFYYEFSGVVECVGERTLIFFKQKLIFFCERSIDLFWLMQTKMCRVFNLMFKLVFFLTKTLN